MTRSLKKQFAALEKKHGVNTLVLAVFMSVRECGCELEKKIGGKPPCMPCRCKAFLKDHKEMCDSVLAKVDATIAKLQSEKRA